MIIFWAKSLLLFLYGNLLKLHFGMIHVRNIFLVFFSWKSISKQSREGAFHLHVHTRKGGTHGVKFAVLMFLWTLRARMFAWIQGHVFWCTPENYAMFLISTILGLENLKD